MTGPEGSVSERIRGNLEELGLDAMASSAPEYSRLVATGAKSFPEALLEMTDAQVAAAGERDLGRRIEKASFPYVKTLRDFDFSFQPSIPRGVVEDLATLGLLERHENVVLVGSPGVGKTHIAVALGVEAIRARKLTYFTDCRRLVSDLAHAAGKGQLRGGCASTPTCRCSSSTRWATWTWTSKARTCCSSWSRGGTRGGRPS